MENNNILQELQITELEERVEFGLCGGSGGGGGLPGDDCSGLFCDVEFPPELEP
ncbi:hypothetical protein [Rheinheimera sp. EpRS3]|jgi:hypothetical protein|uniref:hypothetical protein n=1 Tax=Rheinheimera sp. EpRS3 TaxID=1712383 RepID=UPI000B24D7BF|nr:hypothetical protein [Rheinheimera sp. EpRS3]